MMLRTMAMLCACACALAGDAAAVSTKLAELELSREQGPYEVTTASFMVEVPTAVDPRVSCWIANATKNGKPAPRSRTAVVIFHTPGAKDITGALTEFAKQSGFTAMGCIFPSSGTYAYRDRKRFYGFAASGSFATTARAFEMLRAAQQLNPRVLAFGYSAGGIMSQRFAEEYPELMLGVASACGHTFVQKRGATCPFLIMHTLGDYGVYEGDNLARYYTSQSVPVIRAILDTSWDLRRKDNDHATHALAGEANRLAMRFFESLEDLRQKAGSESAPPVTAWPLVCASADPRQVAKNTPGAVAAIGKMGDQPVYLPSGRVHQLILELPPAPRRTIINGREWVISPTAPDVRPKSAWISLQVTGSSLLGADAAPGNTGDDALLQGDLRFAATHGVLAVGTRGASDDYFALIKDAISACGDVATLPIHLQVIDPVPESFLRIGTIPRLASLSVVFTAPVAVESWAKPFAAVASSRLPSRVLVISDAVQVPALGLPAGSIMVLPSEGKSWEESMRLHQTAVEHAATLFGVPKP